MKHFISLWGITSISVSVTACTVGNWNICGPQTPAAYCDSDAYEKLAHPAPYGTHWVKDGITVEQRRKDSWACGAAKTIHAADHVVFEKEKENLEKRSEDPNDIAAYLRLRASWVKCMELKGYRYEK